MAFIARLGKKTVNLSVSLVQRSIAVSRPKLSIFLGHARKELLPPTPSELGVAMEQAGKVYSNFTSLKFLNLTMKEGAKNVLVGVEICCWFFVGEIIGRGSIVGYKLPGTQE
ncbi:ATP synthase g subunit [Oopsacas minuta]|uniref:ATP synthase g subunit n=1 Tax=Oopsacas minuta TaxID=111878 RepID=A0AAV7KK05_9METZ|nr:ATP synthase g subunit [Oopsacas minuta]